MYYCLKSSPLIMPFLPHPRPLTDNIPRPVFGLQVNLADIGSDYAEAEDLHTAKEQDDADRGGPSGDRVPGQSADERPDNADKAENAHNSTEGRDD